ncbi:uncharacterized protein LOC123524710 [Mercenaria mercenaria]|uniref:uncharacterized protein LOC123524710 n=1 Tax=Mercenaria mercenaria TaxID=6596 RepID=UPI00234F61B9|nr:uncharacterized protein LOC123524710 [Mercenaria mercenaria]
MSVTQKYIDLKYDDGKLTIEEVLNKEKLPVVVRTCRTGSQTVQTDFPQDKDILFQQASKETFAHVKVLKFYDNEKMQTNKGAEYVLEHDTFVDEEYLMPLKFPGKIKLVRRPGSRGRYLTIKQVIGDCPSFVKAENDTKAYLSSDMKQVVTVPAKTVLELKRICTKRDNDCMFLECSDGYKTYTFSENDHINFTVVEKNTLYNLEELPTMPSLRKVILFHGITPHAIVLKDNALRSAMCTIVEGPIEVLGFVNIEYLTCWIRNNHLNTYETMLVPKKMWKNTYVQKRCLHTEEEKENYISKKFGHCLKSDFVSKSLYFLSLGLSDVTWLRSPEFFKQNLEGNVLYEIVKLSYCDSSDEDTVYVEIEEPRPPVPERDKTSKIKIKKSLSETQLKASEVEQGLAKAVVDVKPLLPKPKDLAKTDNVSNTDKASKENDEKRDQLSSRSLPVLQGESRSIHDKNYTPLELTKSSRIYETLEAFGDSLPLGYSKNISDKSQQYIEVGQVKKVLEDNQTEEDFYNYSVKEVSFCFEHCGLKSLADICYEKKLDGSFFKGFNDWKELSLTNLDIIILKKMIYQGWRSKDDSTYGVSTHM